MGIRAIATGLLLLATVAGTLACEMLTPLPGDGPTASSAGNAPMTGPGGANPGMSVGADAGTGGALASSPPSPAVMQELMSRWNLAVDASNATIDFHWPYVNGFPHPTFKGGTAEAYGQFASILLVFLQSNFDFLAQNHLRSDGAARSHQSRTVAPIRSPFVTRLLPDAGDHAARLASSA
jgi:hypothetical protein